MVLKDGPIWQTKSNKQRQFRSWNTSYVGPFSGWNFVNWCTIILMSFLWSVIGSLNRVNQNFFSYISHSYFHQQRMFFWTSSSRDSCNCIQTAKAVHSLSRCRCRLFQAIRRCRHQVSSQRPMAIRWSKTLMLRQK